MTTDPTTQTLAQLGDMAAEQVSVRFAEVRERFDAELSSQSDPNEWPAFLAQWTGRKSGALTRIGENWLKPAPKELKPLVGQEFQKLKAHVEAALEEKRKEIEAAAEQAAAARDQIDLSLPGVERAIGTRHLIRQTFDELLRIFLSIGFSVVEGPEIETPYYNFEALNIPEHHPARDTMDTFYLETPAGAQQYLLRTHTSPMQIRAMENQAPPVRIIVPGKVYRRDNPDATHSYMFHQVEGLAVDTDITFCEFKGTVEYFVREFLGPSIRTRLRPSYFPFTEPSVEIDASCFVCNGSGCRL
ncbi:MAG TPA: phenylalanine--tRNA ligase subunit alpha, partial [Candidatus Acidoferrales bacterium]|nr:phenylalanine--tRNA ligase subunit alpha [Candidatus Acidoferrales bacterium]